LENNYDYFGARYYDSRIANWTSIDPLFEKHFDFSPYNYVLRNPIRLIDPDGKQVDVNEQRAKNILDKELSIWKKVGMELNEKAKEGNELLIEHTLKFGIEYGLGLAVRFAPTPINVAALVALVLFKIATDVREIEGQENAQNKNPTEKVEENNKNEKSSKKEKRKDENEQYYEQKRQDYKNPRYESVPSSDF
jgi:hypothetical protein